MAKFEYGLLHVRWSPSEIVQEVVWARFGAEPEDLLKDAPKPPTAAALTGAIRDHLMLFVRASMARLGEDGWELVAVEHPRRSKSWSSDLRNEYYFKRQID